MKRKLKKLGLVVLGLAAVGLIASVIASVVFTNRLNDEIAAIKTKGEPVTPQEFAGKPIPDSENAAVLYLAVQEKVNTGAYKQDFAVTEKAIDRPLKPLDSAGKERMSTALAHMQPLLDIVYEASLRPECELHVSATVAGQAFAFPEMAAFRRIGRLLRASCLYRAQAGDMRGAVKDLTTEFRFIGQLDGRGTMMHQLVRIALIAIADRTVTDTLQFGDITEQEAKQLYDAVGGIDVAEGFRQAWIGERMVLLSFSDPKSVTEMVHSVRDDRSFWDVLSMPVYALYETTILRGDKAEYLGYMARQLDGMDLPYPEARSGGLLSQSPDFPAYAVLSKMLCPLLSEFAFKQFPADEKVAHTQVFLALQAYKARFGGYPASMQELKSKLGWKLPVDPFSGKDFIYKRQAKGFLLYSIGPDMKDDGGRSIPGDRVELECKGDIVLRWDK